MIRHHLRSSLFALTGVALAALPATVEAQTRFPTLTANRDLLIFVSLAAPYTGPAKTFYQAVEFGAEGMAQLALSSKYRRVHVVKGQGATIGGLVSSLRGITSNRAVLALDVIFVTHGLDSELWFENGPMAIEEVRDQIVQGVPDSWRAKFRMMFSTACYGASHRNGWRQAGFKMVSGSNRIYADSLVSFPVFLGSWGSGSSFATATNAANDSDPLRIQDNIAKGVLFVSGYPQWWDVDSIRWRQGFTSLSIGMQVLGLE